MSRSNNSRKGSKKGNWRCSCCYPKPAKVLEAIKAIDREGRTEDDEGRLYENIKNVHFCDWW